MLHGFQKKIDGFLSDTKSDSTEKIRSGLSSSRKNSSSNSSSSSSKSSSGSSSCLLM